MGRKLLNDVDGFSVDEYAGTFTGTFDVEGADVRYMAYDDEVLLVVRARVKVPRLKETAKGEIVRVNVLGVKEVGVVRSDSLKKHLCDTLGLELPAPQLQFELPTAPEDLQVEDVEEYEPPDTSAFATSIQALGPKVQKFSPDDYEDSEPTVAERAVVGVVGPTKDPRLAAFLSDS